MENILYFRLPLKWNERFRLLERKGKETLFTLIQVLQAVDGDLLSRGSQIPLQWTLISLIQIFDSLDRFQMSHNKGARLTQ